MTIQHPHPEEERSVDYQPTIDDVPTHITEAAQNMRTMHTRLADLLDQVSVTTTHKPTDIVAEDVMPSEQRTDDPIRDEFEHHESDYLEDSTPENFYANNSHRNGYDNEYASVSKGGNRGYENGFQDSHRTILDNDSDSSHGYNIDDAKQSDISTADGRITASVVNGVQDVTISSDIVDNTIRPNSTAGRIASVGSVASGKGEDTHSKVSEQLASTNEHDYTERDFANPDFDERGRDGMPDKTTERSNMYMPHGKNASNDSDSDSGRNVNSAITIKGRSDGIAVEIGAGSWRMLMVQLRQRLQQSSGFFRGGTVSLDLGVRPLTDEELSLAKDILNEHGLNLNLVRATSKETSQAAAALGIAVTLDAPETSASEMALTNHEGLAHFVYRGNLRSGQILRRSETILLLGDVNPGAHVESEGDILVWGRLRGIAHAGSAGDSNAIISAMLMEPTQLRINDSIAVMPASDERRSLFGSKKRNPNLAPRPEVAYIADGAIVVEPWDESKPGGIMAFRR